MASLRVSPLSMVHDLRALHANLEIDDDEQMGRMCIPNDTGLKQVILKEAHDSPFAIHLGGTNMYRAIKEHYWWMAMKKDIIEYVAKCLTCQQVKLEHHVPTGVRSDPLLILPVQEIEVNLDLTYDEKPIKILTYKVKQLAISKYR
ncbi:uncharacterized protein LOC131182889 [Hevea brasiliensis]|uniref:uncharacterized protein LOC131182889 n=1 Tax=Hevea brasiliensis TaxID=3981 RepID=UPI0025EE6F60|nr:uncharacterized protein LOC131182889 [Hevea brasiliensis]